MAMLADREPLAFGLNVTVSVQLAPGASELLVGTQKAELIGEATITAGVTGGEQHAAALTEA